MEASIALAVAGQVVSHLPVWIAWIVAVVLAVIRWKRHPSVSALVVGAVAILAVSTIAGNIFVAYMPIYLSNSGRSATEMGVFFAGYGLVASLVGAGCWGMLIAAIFGWRDGAAGGRDDAR